VLAQIRAVTNSRATYGYRRVWAMVNRTFRTGYNRKRIRRVMQLQGLMLAPRVHRRHDRPHLGLSRSRRRTKRWCSDVFLIPCWSGKVVSVVAIDCHDSEVPAWVASPRPLTGADIRTLMDRTLGLDSARRPSRPRTRSSGSRTTPRRTRRRRVCATRTSSGSCPSRRQRTARKATAWPKPS
jgi:hypothetical protein